MQSHNQKKQQYVTPPGRYHQNKTYSTFFQPPVLGEGLIEQWIGKGDVAGFTGGPGGATGAPLRINQYPAPHPPPAAAAPQPPQGPPQLRTQPQPPSHNPHNATAAAPPVSHSQHHTHTHATLSQHHQVLQSGGVGGHGTGGVGTGVGQVGVPPGPSPAPPGPPHELSSQSLPPGSTPQMQQGSGGSLPVASAHNMMYPSNTQNQPQGPQPNAQGQFFPHPGGPNPSPHMHSSGQPRQVTITHSQHMQNYPVITPNLMPYYPSTHGGSNLVYQLAQNGIRQIVNGVPAGRGRWLSNRTSHPSDIEFQTVGPHRQAAPHTQPGQFHPSPMPQPHPQGHYQAIQYHQPQGGKHEATSPLQYRQPHGVYYPSAAQHQQLKPVMGQAPQRERKTLAIVDPSTGKNILDDMHNEKPDKTPTPPQSSESSARNTPAPSGTPPTKTESAVIAAQFAAEVAKKAAEKDVMDIDTSEHIVRTNKPCDNSSSVVIISDSRESKEKLTNSIANTIESVNSNVVECGIVKTVPESVEVIKPQSKHQQQDSQQISLQQFPHPVPQLQPQHMPQQSLQQLPQQSLQQVPQQSLQLSQPSLQQLPQQTLQQLPQQPLQQIPQQPLQQMPQPVQPPLQQLPQQTPQKPVQPSMQQLPQQSLQQLSQQAQQQLSQQAQQQLSQAQQQLPQQAQQQLPQQAQQQLPQQTQQSLSQHGQQPLSQQAQQPLSQQAQQSLSQQQLSQPAQQQLSQQTQQQLSQQTQQQAPQQLSQPAPQQMKQLPQKQKSPTPQQSLQSAQQPQQPVQQQQPQLAPAQQLPQQPTESVVPQSQSQQLPQPTPNQQMQKPADSLPKAEASVKSAATLQPEGREIQASVKAEPQLPVKQASPKPSAVPTPSQKEKEVSPEPQPAQSKRGKGISREEPTPVCDSTDTPSQTQPPRLPSPPQEATAPPSSPSPPPSVAPQPVNKFPAQVPSSKEKKEKEKTPEPVHFKPQLPPQKPASVPPSKETSPQPTPSPTLSEESKSEHSSKERELNSVECEVNNVHEDKEEEKKDDGPQLKYTYKEDQWSPVNPEGKRQYDRRFLLELQNNPLSLKKPESLPNLEVVRDGPGRHKTYDPRVPMPHGGGGPDFTPDYVKSTLGNKQPRMVTRNSQQRCQTGGGPVNRGGGGGGGGGGGRSGQGKVIIIPHSTGREQRLKTTENAWKPSVKESKTSEDGKLQTEEVVKVMRGILNKLTPEKFMRLVDTVKTLPINTTERLSAVIDLIFEKAVDEQGFSSTYAQMCQVLSLMSVRGNGNDSGNSGKSEVKFRNLIINKCQKEFEKDNTDELRVRRYKEIDACNDPEKKLELIAKYEYDETKMRKRSVGNIRFIGELYKLRMLTSPIMMRIIGTLLEKGDEESLECLCKLLSTIGKILETQCCQQAKAMSELDKHFKHMDKIVNERQTNSRVRFLMMDVIDLRQKNWVPRREDSKPKTKAEVQEEFKREEMEQQIALASNTNRRDDRDRERDRRRPRDNRGPQTCEEGWNTVASTKGRTSFDSSRLKNTFSRPGAAESKEVTLRGTGFSSWARGSSGGGLKDHDEGKQQESNRFNVLGDGMGGSALPGDNRRGGPSVGGNRLAPGGGGPTRQSGFGSKSMPPPANDKESAISAVKKFVGTDRSKSTSRPESRDNSVSRESGDVLKGYPTMDEETAEKFATAIIEEFIHNGDPEEAKLCVKEKFATNTIKYFVAITLEWVIDRDVKKRRMVGQLYHDLIVENLLSVDQLLEGSQSTLRMTEDYIIDIPQVCDYLGEVFAPCLNDNAVSLKRLLELASFAKSKKANVFACILAKASQIMSPNKVADMWNTSGLSWCSIIPPGESNEAFLDKHHVAFTVDRSKSGSQSGWNSQKVETGRNPQMLEMGWNPQKVETEFLKLFKRASNDEIFGWIDANIGNDAKSSKFIRALVTALVESQATTSNDGSSICVSEDFEEKMKNRLAVVLKYVDSNEKLEMQCIYALQALSVKHQHPKGLLEKCFNAFYDSEVVSEEAFELWAKFQDPEEQEGKGVCVNSVKNFMRWLKEADVEETETHA